MLIKDEQSKTQLKIFNKTRSSLLEMINKEITIYLKCPTKINHITSQQYADKFASANVVMTESFNYSSGKKNTCNILLIPSQNSTQSNSRKNSFNQNERQPRKKKLAREKMKHFKVTNINENGSGTNRSNGEESQLDRSFESVISTISHLEEKISVSKEAMQYFKKLVESFKKPKGSLLSKNYPLKNSISLKPTGSNNRNSDSTSIKLNKNDFLAASSTISSASMVLTFTYNK